MNRRLYFIMLVVLFGPLGVRSQQVIMSGPSNIITNNHVDAENKLTEEKNSKQYDGATLFDGLQVASIELLNFYLHNCITSQFSTNTKTVFFLVTGTR